MNNFISPAIADVMLWLMYITLAAAIAVTAYSVWHGLRFRRKGDDVANGVPAGKIGWVVAIGFVLCMAATFLFDMFIYTSIILIIGCFVSAIVSRFRS